MNKYELNARIDELIEELGYTYAEARLAALSEAEWLANAATFGVL